MLKDNPDIDIQYYAMVDFKILQQRSIPPSQMGLMTDDAMKGHEVEVPDDLNMKDGVVPVIKVGKQRMDGRYRVSVRDDEGDFGRTVANKSHVRYHASIRSN